MSEVKYHKIGSLKVVDGTYEKDGVKRNRYHEVGVLLASPHGSRLFVMMHATATSEPKPVNIFLEDGKKLNLVESAPQEEVGF